MDPTVDTGEPRYPIQAVAARTGLAASLLRAWERRYKAVQPARSPAGERLYTDRQIHRLNLLRMLRDHGHTISRIATLPEAELERLLLDVGISPFDAPIRAHDSDLEHVLFGRGRAAINALDPEMLDVELDRARTVLTPLALIDSVVCPLMRRAERMSARGPVVRAAIEGMIELLTDTARTVARVVAPLGSGRPMLVWNLGYPRDASLAMAAATTSLQGLHAEVLPETINSREVLEFLRLERSVGLVVSIPCDVDADRAREVLLELREGIGEAVVLLCVAPVPEVFSALEGFDGCEVCSTFRELAELIDANRS